VQHSLLPRNFGGHLNSNHLYGTHVPVEEPSTASEAEAPRLMARLRRRLTTNAKQPFAPYAVLQFAQ
jgi:hypothetical protein